MQSETRHRFFASIVLCLFVQQSAVASPQFGRAKEDTRRSSRDIAREERQQLREQSKARQIEKANEHQKIKRDDQLLSTRTGYSGGNKVNVEGAKSRSNRLSAEERQVLRRQIHEARRDIFLQKRQ